MGGCRRRWNHSPGQLCRFGLQTCHQTLSLNPLGSNAWKVWIDIHVQQLTGRNWWNSETAVLHSPVCQTKHCTKQPEGEFCYQHASLPLLLLKPTSLEIPSHLGSLHKDAAMLPIQPRQGKWLHLMGTVLCPAFALQKHRNGNKTVTEGVSMVFMQNLKWAPGETHSPCVYLEICFSWQGLQQIQQYCCTTIQIQPKPAAIGLGRHPSLLHKSPLGIFLTCKMVLNMRRGTCHTCAKGIPALHPGPGSWAPSIPQQVAGHRDM